MLISLALAATDPLPLPGDSPAASSNLGYAGGFALPDARDRAVGDVEVAVGTVGAVQEEFLVCMASSTVNSTSSCGGTVYRVSAVPGVRAAWTPARGLRVEGDLGWSTEGGLAGSGQLSWSGAVSDRVRLGGFAAGYGKTWSDLSGLGGFAGVGMNLAVAWPRVGLDVSVPFVVLNGSDFPWYLGAALTDANVTFALGGGHALRVGTLSFAPGVGWEWSNERWLARVEVHTMGVITGGRAEVGARF